MISCTGVMHAMQLFVGVAMQLQVKVLCSLFCCCIKNVLQMLHTGLNMLAWQNHHYLILWLSFSLSGQFVWLINCT